MSGQPSAKSRFESASKSMSTLADWDSTKIYPLFLILWGLAGWGATRAYNVYSLLPEIIASHYDFSGQADSTMSKHILVTGLAIVYFAVAALLSHHAYRNRRDPQLRDAAAKEYWLGGDPRWASSVERKRRSQAVTSLALHALITGILVEAFLVYISDVLWESNINAKDHGLKPEEATLNIQVVLTSVAVLFVSLMVNLIWSASALRVPIKKD